MRLLMLAAVVLIASAPPAGAAPLVASDAPPVTITAREQPIAAFLRDLFGQIGTPVIISPGLTGSVNGRFAGPAAQVFRDVARAFSVVGFNDGAAVHLYPASELTVRSFATGRAGAARVIRTADELRLPDAENRLRVASDGTLVASGTPRFVDLIGELARTARTGLDSGYTSAPGRNGRAADTRAEAPQEFRVFFLRYARADDTTVTSAGRELRIPGLATILRGLLVDPRERAILALAQSPARRLSPAVVPGFRQQGMGSLATEPGEETGILGLPPSPGLSFADLETVPMAGPDSVRIEANPAINALIIRDTRARLASYERLIQALDVAPELVEVEATIIDINTTRLKELGIDWRLATGGVNILLGDGTTNDLALQPNPNLNRRDNALAVTPSAPGLSISTVIGSGREFLARISALEQRGAARIVSRPQVMTLSNTEATFDRTRSFFVRVAGEREVDLFNITVGTVLRVNPQVIPHGQELRIQLLVQIEDGQVSRTDAVDGIPLVDRAGVSTRAIILDGESLLLGGQTVDSEFDAERKVPFLGDVPVIGALFRTRSRNSERIERLFLITPRLLTIGPTAATAAAFLPATPSPTPSPTPTQTEAVR